MRTKIPIVLAVVALFVAPAVAHHAFSAEFDANRYLSS